MIDARVAEAAPRPAPPSAPRIGPVELAALARHGAVTAALSPVLTTILWMLMRKDLALLFIYTLCISLSCWLLIDGARILVARFVTGPRAAPSLHGRGLWPGWAWMAPIVVVGGVLGYAAGNAVANAVLGRAEPGPFDAAPRDGLVILVLGIVPGLVITYFFYSRQMLATQRAEMQRAELQATEQRLKLVESQLDPHMLFNTLANLRVLIASDPSRAEAMLDRLIAFLRASLAGSRASRHTLADEFARLADYLALMQVRMGPRLSARFELPTELSRATVPSFLLQPLVENAIRHGLEPKVAGGIVEVVAARDGDALCLHVRDTGVGLAAPARDGFGLGHVRERMATLAGGSLIVADRADGAEGTDATVRLPWSETLA